MEPTSHELKWRELNKNVRKLVKQAPVRANPVDTDTNVKSYTEDQYLGQPVFDLDNNDDELEVVAAAKPAIESVGSYRNDKGKGEVTYEDLDVGTTQLTECSAQFMNMLPRNMTHEEATGDYGNMDALNTQMSSLLPAFMSTLPPNLKRTSAEPPSFDLGFGGGEGGTGVVPKLTNSDTPDDTLAWVDMLFCEDPPDR